MPYYVNQRLSSRVSFVDEDGAAFDPAELRVTYQVPAASRRSPTSVRKVYGTDSGIRRVSAGVYSIAFRAEHPGEAVFVWESTAEGEETVVEHRIPIVDRPEIVRSFTGDATNDNRFTGDATNDNR